MGFQSSVQQFYGSDLVPSALSTGRYISVANSLIGGKVTSILQKQKLMAKAKATGYGTDTSNYQAQEAYVAGIPVSTRMQETYQLQSEATLHALESGAKVTDHVILNPLKVDCSFTVVNMNYAAPRTILQHFIDLWQSRNIVTLITEHQLLENMVLINLQADNAAPEWGKLDFRCTFQQIGFYTLAEVNISNDELASSAKGATSSTLQNTGVTTSQTYTDATSAFSGTGTPGF